MSELPSKEAIIKSLQELPKIIAGIETNLHNLRIERRLLDRQFIDEVMKHNISPDTTDLHAKENIIGQQEILLQQKKAEFQAALAIARLL